MNSASEVHVTAAHHEAGHAVVAYLNGIRPQSITVDEDGRGHFHSDCRTLTAETETMIAMAGPAAEYLFRNPCGGNVPSFAEALESHRHLWSDMDQHDACKHSESLPLEEQRRVREQYWQDTWGMLSSHWSSVQAVAAAIVEKETLIGKQIWDLIEGHSYGQPRTSGDS
jgi:hypothetical protein